MSDSGKKQLAKTYNPAEFETRVYSKWEKNGAFKPRDEGEAYTIMMPPPNVTGRLHMGHALNMTLQDIMARFMRQQGKAVLWQAGTDHAGIATQAVVERELLKEGNQSRQEIGRVAFEKKVWEWKERSGGDIVHQLKRLGASCDWNAARFTLDEGMSQAVRYAFVELYEKKLIYRAERLVNWDVKLKTAISDLEVDSREVKGHLWHLRYALENGGGDIVVATTRPETMLGDCAVAVHPQDERYKNLIGQNAILPLAERAIPIIADEYADPKQGSGAVKITPAHDFNDFEVGLRHNLTPINILDENGAIINDEIVPASYRGLSRQKARAQIVTDLESIGRLEKIEDIKHTVPYGERSNEIVEPYLTKQWFVDAEKLAKKAICAVEEGETKFKPSYWEKTYFNWMNNIQPWCISRQLWWGHRIPVWYDEEGEHYAAMTKAEAQAKAGAGKKLRQDEDVLDTWFSSGLWALSTLGWKNEAGGKTSADAKEVLAKYYPTELLITGLDIIFFWVARMMMLSLYFMEKTPFKNVYIHALVRDAKGQKMTKSRGNVVDPLELIDEYGADALRFTMAAMSSEGQDVKLSKERVRGYRNFATKLWNAARFCEMNDCVYDKDFEVENVVNKWIIKNLNICSSEVKVNLENYQFNLAAETIYHFVWGDFCDWYLEFAKVNLNEMGEKIKIETQKTLAFALREILIVLHPFMPFITETLWQDKDLLIAEHSPPPLEHLKQHKEARDLVQIEVYWIIRIIEKVRRCYDIFNVPQSFEVGLHPAINYGHDMYRYCETYLPKITNIRFFKSAAPKQSLLMPIEPEGGTFHLDFGNAIDIDAAKSNIGKRLSKTKKEFQKLERKLNDEEFINKANNNAVVNAEKRLALNLMEQQEYRLALEYLENIS